MPSHQLKEVKQRKLVELAKGWGKIAAGEAYGPDGPGLDVDLAGLEQIAVQLQQAFLKGFCEATTQQQAGRLPETLPCPQCGGECQAKIRGLLDDTLVVWGGEFGRPGLTPHDGNDETGHNARGFTFWMAGGGVKGGYVHGKTDPTGSRAVEGKVHFRDLHATILHLLGLPPNDLKYWHAGRDHRLTGPEGGQVVHEFFA